MSAGPNIDTVPPMRSDTVPGDESVSASRQGRLWRGFLLLDMRAYSLIGTCNFDRGPRAKFVCPWSPCSRIYKWACLGSLQAECSIRPGSGELSFARVRERTDAGATPLAAYATAFVPVCWVGGHFVK